MKIIYALIVNLFKGYMMKAAVEYFIDLDSFLENKKNSTTQYILYVTSNTPIEINKLQETSNKIYGAFFPQIVYNNRLYSEGLIAFELDEFSKLHKMNSIENPDFAEMALKDAASLVCILDGFSVYNESFLPKLYGKVNLYTNIIGAGAGSLDNNIEGALFSNEGFFNDGALLVEMNSPINIGVRHGWEYLAGPFVATKSEQNRLYTIDYQDAFKLYSKVIKEDCGIELNSQNYLEVTKNYPFGIVKYEGEQIVRDPIKYENGSLVLVGEIKENSIINILKGDKNNLLKAAKSASQEALKNNCQSILLFDCVSRVSFLGKTFDDELQVIAQSTKDANIVGAISLGEIANRGKKFIHFYNKTCVVGGLCN